MKLPIGDWSRDGHGKCDWFLIESNLPVEEVREAYFKACDILGEDLSRFLCDDPEERTVEKEKFELLKNKGVDISDLVGNWSFIDESYEIVFEDTKDFATYILRCLNKLGNKDFAWEILDNDIPMIPFYGVDDKNRSIGYFGYGLFD